MTDSQTQMRRGPLAGIRVLDFSRILSGPYASMVLADLGAEIIKIEPMGNGDDTRNFPPFQGGLSHYYIALNRSKKSLALDLKSEDGLRIARELAATCDIVLENFRPGVMDRLALNLSSVACCIVRPRVIVPWITAGCRTPWAGAVHVHAVWRRFRTDGRRIA